MVLQIGVGIMIEIALESFDEPLCFQSIVRRSIPGRKSLKASKSLPSPRFSWVIRPSNASRRKTAAPRS